MIGFIPENSVFNPGIANTDKVTLNFEEVEALRLSDLLEMEQDSAAESMNISRGTFQRIINSARHKVADALVHGKSISIEGGEYKVIKGGSCCKKHTKFNNNQIEE
jgi:predicted DNA-binding protein (UPF0251 family)